MQFCRFYRGFSWILAVAFVLAGLGVFCPARADEACTRAQALALEGVRLFEQDAENGIRHLHEAHAACPDHWAVSYNLGLALYRSGKPAQAYAQWKGLSEKGTSRLLLENLGWLALELDKAGEADAWLDKREKAGKSDANTLILAMEVLFARGKYEQALDLSFTSIRLVPYAYRKLAVENATEDMWSQFRAGQQGEAIDRAADLAERFPEVKSLDALRDTMVAALLDDNVAIPEPRPYSRGRVVLPADGPGPDLTGEKTDAD